MLYDIALHISYKYENAANTSRDIVRLVPVDLPGEQRLVAGTLDINPEPDEWLSRVDFFGNPSVEVAFLDAHHDIEFSVYSRVERLGKPLALDISPGLSDLAGEILAVKSVEPDAPHHFAGPSPRVPFSRETTDYALEAASGVGSVLEIVSRLGEALHKDIKYDPKATTVDTPMLEAFKARRGVCQDYSHIMIASLRGIGIPAGYVSGFLRTNPPPGKERLEGADAMHAWVRAWCGTEMGWIEYDPTNALLVETDHIVVARGRDYSDVAPVRGVMRTHGAHKTKQEVSVKPLDGG